jgi:FkbH-like protein
MKLIEALEVIKRPVVPGTQAKKIFLACGFTPLHVQTFLEAELRLLCPQSRIEIETGLFGDLIGNLERLNPSGIDSVAVVIEWGDLDPRLTIRNLGGWRIQQLSDIEATAAQTSARVQQALTEISRFVPVVVCMPTLPLPAMFHTDPAQTSSTEATLSHVVASLVLALSRRTSIRIVNTQLLGELSSAVARHDVRSEVNAGFPYTVHHASVVATLVARLLHSGIPKKGLITDLDDTLWRGILGEDGVEGVSWDIERRTLVHGVYQQFLASLADAGVLLAVASKNDSDLVERAFDRADLLISRTDIFPFEAHWSNKSESVKRILDTWNIAPDSVVFVDDSPMELAEVKTAFPQIECILFPKQDIEGALKLMRHLRGVFGKPYITADDSLRLGSIRNANALRTSLSVAAGSSDEFLKSAGSTITINTTRVADDMRAFELVNKTNQFNLNGRRYSESEWQQFFRDPRSFLLTASYQDKYGSIGKIAVILGKTGEHRISINTWVMSCRAFSRRIEHQCLNYLFETFKLEEVAFEFETTPRNAALQSFFLDILGVPPRYGVTISRTDFERVVPPLFHSVAGVADV